MTLPPATYDLTLLLDPDAEEATRAKIVADARAAIEARGELARLDEWGTRPLSYPIERRRAADYYLLQFHAAAPELLADLQRSLRITDGILRFRLIKLRPGVPPAPDLRVSTPTSRTEAAPGAAPATPPTEAAAVEVEPTAEPDDTTDVQPGDGAEPGGASAPRSQPEDATTGGEAAEQPPPAAEQAQAGEPAPGGEPGTHAGETEPPEAS